MRRRSSREPRLIDWSAPRPQAKVLDWRRRASRWGLNPVGADDTDEPSVGNDDLSGVLRGSALLADEEPEADSPQTIGGGEEDAHDLDSLERERLERGVAETSDSVRRYLAQIGGRRLLTADEEAEIGYRIELARADLQAALGRIPCAVQSLVELADAVRHGGAPAAELILLPDGGELRPERVAPVLGAMTRIARLERCRIRWGVDPVLRRRARRVARG
jgi:hypothetical protein